MRYEPFRLHHIVAAVANNPRRRIAADLFGVRTQGSEPTDEFRWRGRS
jgi:hypothetical protein